MSIFLFTLHLTLLQTDGFDNKVTIYPVYGILTYDGFNYFTSTQTIGIWDLITMELSLKDFATVC